VPLLSSDASGGVVGYGPMISALRTSLHERVARLAAHAAGTAERIADAPQQTHAQHRMIDTDPNRVRYNAMMHDPDRTWFAVPCSGGCGKQLRFSGSCAEIDWTCRSCVPFVSSPPTLRLVSLPSAEGDQ